MSRKSKRNLPTQGSQDEPQPQSPRVSWVNRRNLFIASAATLILAFVVGALLYRSEKAQSAQQAAAKNVALLVRDHSPTFGKADAKVHIVEFLDPACETCGSFYPEVKKLMAANPDRIRLSVRHVPFHKGSDEVVRILEAARSQDKYPQTLEAAFASQYRWAPNHAVVPDMVWASLGGVGLDLDRIRNDMNAPEISRRMEQDLGDAKALGVTMTPEFFVNGRPLPSFGLEQLQGLVKEELRNAYP